MFRKLSRFSRSLWLALVMLVFVAGIFVAYTWAGRQVVAANELRFKSFMLADELRQSSEDLTRMAHAYVVTGNPLYKKYFQEIIAIRDGKQSHPLQYNNIYWDLVGESGERPSGNGPAIALLDMMRQAGFSKAEFAKLAEAKVRSDELTRTEYAAMALADTNRDKAIRMLADAAYHKAKSDIMQPISEFHELMDKRTQIARHAAKQTAMLLRIVFLAGSLILVLLLLNVYRALHATLGCTVDKMQAHIMRLGSGDFSSVTAIQPEGRDSVLGWLSEMQKNLQRINQEHKQSFEALERYRRVINRSRDGYWLVDTEGSILEANQAYADMTGYSIEELVGMNVRQIDALDDEEKVRARIGEILATGGALFETKHRHKDGALIEVEVSTSYMQEQGQIVSFFRDITERKQAEALLLEKDYQLSESQKIAHVGSWYRNLATNNLSWSEEAYCIFGVTPETFTPSSESFMSLIVPDDRPAMQNWTAECLAGNSPPPLEFRILRDNGELRVLSGCGVLRYGTENFPSHLLGIVLDVTERKQSERLLNFHSDILSRVAQGVYLVRPSDGVIVYTNPQFESMFGYDAGELIGSHVSILNAPTMFSPKERAGDIMSCLEREGNWRGEIYNIKKNGDTFLCHAEIATLDHPEFGFVWVTSHHDISGISKAHQALEGALAFSSSLINAMRDGLVVRDKSGVIKEVNPAFCRISGFSREELIGSGLPAPYWPPEHYESIAEAFQKTKMIDAHSFEAIYMRKNGERFSVSVSPANITNKEDGIVFHVATFQDISLLRTVEKEIEEAKKAVHRDLLVREVHHRIKNNLQGITGVLRLSAVSHPELAAPIQQAIGQVNSVAMIHGLQGRTGMSRVRFCELTSAIASEAEKLWGKKIPFDIPLNWKPFIVNESEAVPIALVLHELIANAVKHGQDVNIRLRLGLNAEEIILSIDNVGVMPVGLSMNNAKSLGTGLQLVASLMPRHGATLHWEQHDDIMTTILVMDKPVIQAEKMYVE